MFRGDGALLPQNSVVLINKRDVTIIKRAEIRRIVIVGNELHWLDATGHEHTHEFEWTGRGQFTLGTCEIVVEVFDSIVFGTGDVVWLRQSDGSWKKLDDNFDTNHVIDVINESSK